MTSQLRDLASRIEDLAREHPAYSQAWKPVANLTDHLCAMARCEESNQQENIARLVDLFHKSIPNEANLIIQRDDKSWQAWKNFCNAWVPKTRADELVLCKWPSCQMKNPSDWWKSYEGYLSPRFACFCLQDKTRNDALAP